MAGFRKRGKTWEYKISRGVEKPITKGGFKTKKEAEVAATEVENKLNRGLAPMLEDKPFDEYFENWIRLYKTNIANVTKTHYQYSLDAVKRYFGSKPIQKITRNDYQLFINDFGSTRAKETVDKLNRHVRSCVKDAVEDQVIPFDFTRKTTITYTVKAKRADEKHLNFEDSTILQNELYKRLDEGLGYYMLLLALNSGMRYSEIVGLTRKDFNLKNNTINVDKTFKYRKNEVGFATTKNFEVRTIKMNKKVMSVFKDLFDKLPNNIEQLAFYSPSSKYKVISNTNVNKLLKKTLDDLGIDNITIHGLRHTHASILLYKKVSVNYVSERLGHKNVETTWKTYSHILKEMREEDEKQTLEILDSMVV